MKRIQMTDHELNAWLYKNHPKFQGYSFSTVISEFIENEKTVALVIYDGNKRYMYIEE